MELAVGWIFDLNKAPTILTAKDRPAFKMVDFFSTDDSERRQFLHFIKRYNYFQIKNKHKNRKLLDKFDSIQNPQCAHIWLVDKFRSHSPSDPFGYSFGILLSPDIII